MICPRKPHSLHHSANAPIRRYTGDPRSPSPSGRSSCGGRITHLALGTVIHLIASGPAVPTGLAAWCHRTGHAYLGRCANHPVDPAYALHTSAAYRVIQPHSRWRLTRQASRPNPARRGE